jgi:hypothetical protein
MEYRRKAKIPTDVDWELIGVEQVVQCGVQCNFYPSELSNRLGRLITAIRIGGYSDAENWAKEIVKWSQEWENCRQERLRED